MPLLSSLSFCPVDLGVLAPIVTLPHSLKEIAPTITQSSTLDRSVTEPSDRKVIKDFLAGRVGPEALPEPNWGPIGREVYDRTYSRIKDNGEREVWAETVRRVVNGNIGFAPASVIQADEAVRLFDLFYTFKASPAGRHLWTVGAGIPFSRNCFVSGFSPRTSDHFKFLAMRLFEGGGVGSNYSNDLISVMPPVLGSINAVIFGSPLAIRISMPGS